MRSGRRLALDVGKVRIGVAVCDRDGILASPLPALTRSKDIAATIAAITALAGEQGCIEIYVGEPLSLSGGETESTNDARLVASSLASSTALAVRLIDERLTTVSAASKLRAAGIDSKRAKSIIDSASAVEILENALNFEKKSGLAPGHLVGDSVGA